MVDSFSHEGWAGREALRAQCLSTFVAQALGLRSYRCSWRAVIKKGERPRLSDLVSFLCFDSRFYGFQIETSVELSSMASLHLYSSFQRQHRLFQTPTDTRKVFSRPSLVFAAAATRAPWLTAASGHRRNAALPRAAAYGDSAAEMDAAEAEEEAAVRYDSGGGLAAVAPHCYMQPPHCCHPCHPLCCRSAAAAVIDAYVRDGSTISLGTGAAIAFLLEDLAARLASGALKGVRVLAASEQTASEAALAGVPQARAADGPLCSLYVDVADELALDPSDESIAFVIGRSPGPQAPPTALARARQLAAEAATRVVIAESPAAMVPRLGGALPVVIQGGDAWEDPGEQAAAPMGAPAGPGPAVAAAAVHMHTSKHIKNTPNIPPNLRCEAEELDDLFLGDAEVRWRDVKCTGRHCQFGLSLLAVDKKAPICWSLPCSQVWRRSTQPGAGPRGGDAPVVTPEGWNVLDIRFGEWVEHPAQKVIASHRTAFECCVKLCYLSPLPTPASATTLYRRQPAAVWRGGAICSYSRRNRARARHCGAWAMRGSGSCGGGGTARRHAASAGVQHGNGL